MVPGVVGHEGHDVPGLQGLPARGTSTEPVLKERAGVANAVGAGGVRQAAHVPQVPAELREDAVKRLTGGKGVDLILDIMGGSYVNRNLAALGVEGRLVQIGLMGGETASLDLRRVMGRRLTITGSTLRPRPVEEKGAIAAALAREVWPALEQGVVKPIVYKTFPLTDAAGS